MSVVLSSVPSSNNNDDVGSGDLNNDKTLKTSNKYIKLILFSLLIIVVVSHCH